MPRVSAARLRAVDPRFLPVFSGVLAVYVVLLGGLALTADYVFDDNVAVLNNPLVRWPPPIGDILTGHFFGNGNAYAHMPLWRPLATLSYCIEAGLGLGPGARKLLSVLLHAGAAALLFGVLRALAERLGKGEDRSVLWTSGVAATLFVVHPTHASSVLCLAYRTELLAAVCLIGGTWALLSRRAVWWTPVLFALGLMSKESAIVAVAPWAALALVLRDRRMRTPLLVSGLIAAAYLLFRRAIFGAITVSGTPFGDNPLAHVGAAERLPAAFSLVARGALQLVFPPSLSPDYSFDALGLPDGWGLLPVVGVAISVLAAVGIGLGARAALKWKVATPDPRYNGAATVALAGVALVWMAAFWAPASNLLFPSTIVFADRLLVLSSAAACPLIAFGLDFAWRQAGYAKTLAVGPLSALLILFFAATTADYSRHWTTDRGVFTAGVAAQPRSVRMRLNLGLLELRQGHAKEAMPHLQAAVEVAPQDHDALAALLTAAAQTHTCAPIERTVNEVLGHGVAPRTVRVGLLRWAVACDKRQLAAEIAPGLKR